MLNKLHLGMNPIIVKELRSRMRDARAFITMTLVLLLLGGASYLVYRIALQATIYSNAPVSPQIGQSLFLSLTFLVLMMISAIAPAVTAGAVSGEKEKLTYEMLLATPLRPGSILWGKLISALSYVFLLIFAAVPMFSLIFIFGGVTVRDMIKALIILLAVAITLGMLGMFMSTWLGRTARATVVSYVIVAGLYLLPIVLYVAVGILRQAEPPRWLLVPSPLSALFSAITTTSSGAGWNPFYTIGLGLGGNLGVLTGSMVSLNSIPRPLYHYSMPFYGTLTLVLYFLSTRLILPTQRWKLRRKDILVSLGIFLILAGIVTSLFLLTTDRYERMSIFAMPPANMGMVGMVQPAVPVGPVVVERAIMVEPEAAPPLTPADPPPDVKIPAQAMAEIMPEADESEIREAAVYAAVTRQLYYVDHVYGSSRKPPLFTTLHLFNSTDDGVGDPTLSMRSLSKEISDHIQAGVVAALVGPEAGKFGEVLPADIIWTDTADTNKYSPGMSTFEDGALLIFGNIFSQEDNSVMVSAAIYSSEGARGKTYFLALIDDDWMVTGDTGGEWVR